MTGQLSRRRANFVSVKAEGTMAASWKWVTNKKAILRNAFGSASKLFHLTFQSYKIVLCGFLFRIWSFLQIAPSILCTHKVVSHRICRQQHIRRAELRTGGGAPQQHGAFLRTYNERTYQKAQLLLCLKIIGKPIN